MKENKNLTLIAKILYILSMVGRVGAIIGASALILVCVILPFGINKVKVKDNRIKIFDEVIKYEKVDGQYELTYKDEKISLDKVEKDAVTLIIDICEDTDFNKIIIMVELVLVYAIVTLILTFIILLKAGKIFKNIMIDEVFNMENAKATRFIGIIYIVQIALSTIVSAIVELLVKTDLNINLVSVDIMSILLIFGISFIFERGIQEEKEKVTE